MAFCDEIGDECTGKVSCEECLFGAKTKPSYADLLNGLKYAHRFAIRRDDYDEKYVQDIIDRI